MPSSRITSKGQITVPKEVRERLGVEPGDALEFRYEDDRYEIRPVRRVRVTEFRGLFRVNRALTIQQEREKAWAAQVRRLLTRVHRARD